MRKYELIPTDGRKSFYGKAVVMALFTDRRRKYEQ